MAAQTNPKSLMIIILPHKDWYNKQHSLAQPPRHLHTLIHTSSHTHQNRCPNTPSQTQTQNNYDPMCTPIQEPLHYPHLCQRFNYCLEIALHPTYLSFTQNPNLVVTTTKVHLSKKWKHAIPTSYYFKLPPPPPPPNFVLHKTTT